MSMGSQPKKIEIPAPKAGKPQEVVKSLVNPDMRTRDPLGL